MASVAQQLQDLATAMNAIDKELLHDEETRGHRLPDNIKIAHSSAMDWH